MTTNPENTIFDAKRLIGRDWSEPTVQRDVKYFPFKVIVRDKTYTKINSVRNGII